MLLRQALRAYSTAPPTKTPVKLVAELRKLTEVSIVKAREALAASNNDITAALDWLNKDLVASGAKKAAKVQDRYAGEGLISVAVLSPGSTGQGSNGLRAAMVELNCETDFVGRNDLFGELAADVAHTAAFLSEDAQFQAFPVDALHDAPLLSARNPSTNPDPNMTVSRAIRDLISKVGENVVLRRAVSIAQPAPAAAAERERGQRLISYLHGSVRDPMQGRIGVVALLNMSHPGRIFASKPALEGYEKLERALARQIAGFQTLSVRADAGDETALYQQPFMIPGELSGQPVGEALATWARTHELGDNGVEVERFAKWSVGEPIETS
ncbi:Elongation factor Ts, mitochondrial [Mycena kentingensis (nom. inval.)]|nr:Elongation factor Ts, mitochondrial [Mycena kentingensis (nom. inval.)]